MSTLKDPRSSAEREVKCFKQALLENFVVVLGVRKQYASLENRITNAVLELTPGIAETPQRRRGLELLNRGCS